MYSLASAAPAPIAPPRPPAYLPEVVEPKSPEPRRARPWWLLGLIAAIAAGVSYWQSRPPAPARPKVLAPRTSVVRRGPVVRTLRLAGVTVAQKSATLLTPQLIGVRADRGSDFLSVLEKLAPSGSRVRKGDIVAEFDSLLMLNRMDDYRAWVVQHRNNIRNLNALLDVKRENYRQQIRASKAAMDKAALDMQKAPILSANDLERFRLNLEEARARYKQIGDEARYMEISEKAAIRRAELDLQQCLVEFRRAQGNLDRMVVHAPIDGLIVMQSVRRGGDTSEIQQGDQLYRGQPYMQIVDLSSMAIEAGLNGVDAEQVRIGQRARVFFDAYPDLELPARVVSIGAFSRSRGWRGNFVTEIAVRLRFEKTDPRVIPNFSVGVDLELKRVDDAVVVPLASVFADGGRQVAFVGSQSGWEKREVSLGLANHVAAEVKAGLREGEMVAAERPVEARP